jgi:hypothetical protein
MIQGPVISWLGIAPEIVLAVGAALVLLIEVQWSPSRRVLAGFAGGVLVVALGFSVALHRFLDIGEGIDTLLPFAGMIALDGFGVFARYVLLAAAGLGMLTAWRMVEEIGTRAAEMLALMLLATTGFSMMAISANLMMTFLGLEVGSISLYILAGFAGSGSTPTRRPSSTSSSALSPRPSLCTGSRWSSPGPASSTSIGMRDYLTGVIVFEPGVILLGLGLVVVGLAFKVTAAPFHSWAPDVYQGAPAGVVGFMAAVAKIGGFAALPGCSCRPFPPSTATGRRWWRGSPPSRWWWARPWPSSRTTCAACSPTRVSPTPGSSSPVCSRGVRDRRRLVLPRRLQRPAGRGLRRGHRRRRILRHPLRVVDYAGLARRQPFLAATFSVILFGMGGLPLTAGIRGQVRGLHRRLVGRLPVGGHRGGPRLGRRVLPLPAGDRHHVHGRPRGRRSSPPTPSAW